MVRDTPGTAVAAYAHAAPWLLHSIVEDVKADTAVVSGAADDILDPPETLKARLWPGRLEAGQPVLTASHRTHAATLAAPSDLTTRWSAFVDTQVDKGRGDAAGNAWLAAAVTEREAVDARYAASIAAVAAEVEATLTARWAHDSGHAGYHPSHRPRRDAGLGVEAAGYPARSTADTTVTGDVAAMALAAATTSPVDPVLAVHEALAQSHALLEEARALHPHRHWHTQAGGRDSSTVVQVSASAETHESESGSSECAYTRSAVERGPS